MDKPQSGSALREPMTGFVWLRSLNSRIERLFATLAGACLALFTVIVLVDVIYRQILAQPLMWPSEWAVMAFVWSVMFGASVSARRKIHFVVELIPDLGGRVDKALRIIVALLSLLFGVVLLYFGYDMASTGLRRYSPMMGYQMIYVYTAFPVAGAAFILFTTEHLIAAVFDYAEPEGQQAGGGVD